MHHALTHAGVEHGILDTARPACGVAFRVSVVQEHQIKVRTVTQFYATEFAIADDHKLGLQYGLALCICRVAVFQYHLLIGQLRDFFQRHFSQHGEVVTDAHQWLGSHDFTCGGVQLVSTHKLSQLFHLQFEVFWFNPQQSQVQLFGQLSLIRNVIKAFHIQQLIEQHRRFGNVLGNPAGRAA